MKRERKEGEKKAKKKKRRKKEKKEKEPENRPKVEPLVNSHAFDIACLLLEANKDIIKKEQKKFGALRWQKLKGHNVQPDTDRIRIFQRAIEKHKKYNYKTERADRVSSMDVESVTK